MIKKYKSKCIPILANYTNKQQHLLRFKEHSKIGTGKNSMKKVNKHYSKLVELHNYINAVT